VSPVSQSIQKKVNLEKGIRAREQGFCLGTIWANGPNSSQTAIYRLNFTERLHPLNILWRYRTLYWFFSHKK